VRPPQQQATEKQTCDPPPIEQWQACPPLGKTPPMLHRRDAQSRHPPRIANPQTGCDCIAACARFRAPPSWFSRPHVCMRTKEMKGLARSILTVEESQSMRESLSRCAHSLITDRSLAGTGNSCSRPLGLAAIYLAPSCLRRHCMSRARTVI